MIERRTYATLRSGTLRLAKALDAKGFGVGSRIGSLAWNTVDHVELFYGVLGIGSALHTLNPRLTAEHLAYMINQVDDEIIFIDGGNITIAETVFERTPNVRAWIYMDQGEGVLSSTLPNLIGKAGYLDGTDDDFAWPTFDKRRAATICYPSGTTDMPKASSILIAASR